MHNILKIFSIVTILSTAQAEAGGKENPVGYLCPEWNPGDKLNNKFNDSGNRTYLNVIISKIVN